VSNYTGSVPDTAPRPTDWLSKAPCKADPEAMFPRSTSLEGIQKAKAFCRRCTAVDRCLQWALETGEEHGVWGGLTEEERRTRRRRAARAINIDDYTGAPRSYAPVRTLEEAWTDGTEPDGDHLRWIGPKVVHSSDKNVTPNRLSFYLDRGRWPEGEARRTCAVHGCVKPEHLNDQLERDASKAAA
jgi:hypothetical protein